MNEEMREEVEGAEDPACSHGGDCKCESPKDETPSPQGGEGEEIALAFLLALMPLVVLTFFGQVGLI